MRRFSRNFVSAVVACSAVIMFAGTANASQNNQKSNSRNLTVRSAPRRDAQMTPVHHYFEAHRQSQKTQPASIKLSAARHRTSRHRTRRINHTRRRRVRNRIRRTNRHRSNHRRIRRHTRHASSRSPRAIAFHGRNVKQKRSALGAFSKRKFRYVNNSHSDFVPSVTDHGTYGDGNYSQSNDRIKTKADSPNRVTFYRDLLIPKKLGQSQFYSPQGLVIVGHYAYVSTNATNSYQAVHAHDTDNNRHAKRTIDGNDLAKKGNPAGKSPYHKGAVQIIRINLNSRTQNYNQHLKSARRNIKVGPVFYGGHGQGLAYNPRTHQLWLLNNEFGQLNKTSASLISFRTLAPIRKVSFRFGSTTLGDDLTFDRRGRAVNVTEAGNDSFAKPDSIKFYQGKITPDRVRLNLIRQGLRYAPSDVIQDLSYNPRNRRLYITGDDSIISVPEDQLGKLKPANVRSTRFATTREFEGLSFDRSGRGYLLVSRIPEILRTPDRF